MNITEAFEEVLAAAQSMVAYSERNDDKMPDCIVKLRRAIAKVEPRVKRMRSRLDAIRARKSGKPNCPKWAMP
jgi:hypothetical protein